MQKGFSNIIVNGRKMKKKCMYSMAILLLAVCFTGGVHIPAYAVDASDQIKPYYVGATDATCGLDIASGKATCEGTVILRSGYSASLTLKLQKSPDGKSWSTLKTWTATGTSISKPYYVSSGYNYRATLTAKVYNSSGTLVDNITRTSPTKSY